MIGFDVGYGLFDGNLRSNTLTQAENNVRNQALTISPAGEALECMHDQSL